MEIQHQEKECEHKVLSVSLPSHGARHSSSLIRSSYLDLRVNLQPQGCWDGFGFNWTFPSQMVLLSVRHTV